MPLKRRLWVKGFGRQASSALLMGANSSLSFFVILSLALILVSVFRPQVVSSFRSSAIDVLVPTFDYITSPITGLADILRDVSGIASLQTENALLKQENARLRDWHRAALFLEQENAALQDLNNIHDEATFNFITAKIFSSSDRSFAKSLLVAAGAAQGVKKGQAVLSGAYLVGRIIEVSENTSRVLLLNDVNSRVPVFIEGIKKHALLTGVNDKSPALIHLPEDVIVGEGASVITSGFGGMFPYGIPVGKTIITKSEKMEVVLFSDLSRDVYVKILNKI